MSGSSRPGFALLAALALLALMSMIALDVSATIRPRRLALAGAVERGAATEAATAGVEHARAILFGLDHVPPARAGSLGVRAADPWSAADGALIGPITIGAFAYRVELHDATARLNLNEATDDQLRRLLLALRVDARRADRLAEAIADWRDHDDLPRMNGAERDAYVRAGRAVTPENGSFRTVAQLRLVFGAPDSLIDILGRYLTVYGSGRVNLNAALRPVLLALPGMTDESADLILRYRRLGRRVTSLDRLGDELSSGARQRWREAMPALSAMAVTETREVHVAVEASQRQGIAHARIDAVISRDADGRVVWRRVSP